MSLHRINDLNYREGLSPDCTFYPHYRLSPARVRRPAAAVMYPDLRMQIHLARLVRRRTEAPGQPRDSTCSASQRRGARAAARAEISALRLRRSVPGMDRPACSASAVAVTSKGLTISAASPIRAAAPASRDSTSAQPRSLRIGPSSATRFMPSLIGLTRSTSAAPQAASERG